MMLLDLGAKVHVHLLREAIKQGSSEMMVVSMLLIVQNSRLLLTAVTPTAVTPTAVAPTAVIL